MGHFIAIEGGDGSGKGTQTNLLGKYLESEGYDVYQLAFPRYGEHSAYYVEQYLNGRYGEANDVHPELASLAYALDRYVISEDIKKHLKGEKSVVLADRAIASNFAHQGTKIDEKEQRIAFYQRTMLTEYELLGFPKPDLNIVLVVPSAVSQLNVDKKDPRSYTAKKRDVHEADASHLEKAKFNFEELCILFPDEFRKIDCMKNSKQMKSIHAIQSEIRSRVLEQLSHV